MITFVIQEVRVRNVRICLTYVRWAKMRTLIATPLVNIPLCLPDFHCVSD